MSRRIAWSLVLALVVAAIVYWIVQRDTPGDTGAAPADQPQTDPDGGTAKGHDQDAPTLIGIDHTGAGLASCTLVGRVLARWRLTPATVYLQHLDEGDPASTGAKRRVPPHLFEPLHLDIDAAVATAAPSGRFRIEGVQTGGYQLFARTEDGRVGHAFVWIEPNVAHAESDINLRGGPHTLRGRAVYEDGRPFQGWIEAGTQSGFDLSTGWGRYGQPVRTDAQGRFTLQGLPSVVVISAVDPGVLRYVDVQTRLPSLVDYTLVIPDGPVRARGRVIDATTRRGISGATVTAHSTDALHHLLMKRLSTADEGAFEVGLLARFSLVVEAHDYATQKVYGVDKLDGLEIALEKEGRIHGRVRVRGTSKPAPGATVHAFCLSAGQGFNTKAVADETGAYELEDIAPGTVLVAVGQGAWCTPGLERLKVQVEPGADVEQDLLVVSTARVAGRVLDTDDLPVANAHVQTEGVFAVHASTDPTGRFVLEGVHVGVDWTLRIEAAGYRAFVENWKPLSPGHAVDIERRLQSHRHLAVEVLDADNGTPVADTFVKVRSTGEETHVRATTNEEGRCELDVADGPLEVWLEPDTHLPLGKWLPVAGSQTPARQLTASVRVRAGTTIFGVVVDEAGAPVPGTRVNVGGSLQKYGKYAYTDATGRFRVKGIEDKETSLRLSLPDDFIPMPTRKVVPGSTELRIEVRRGKTLVLPIEDEDGSPVPGVRGVLFAPSGHTLQSGWSASNGVLRLKGVDPKRTYDLLLTPPSRKALLRKRTRKWKPASQTLRMARAYEISGRVVDETGRGIAGAALWYSSEKTAGWSSTRTDEDGHFRIGGVPNGRVLVWAQVTPEEMDSFLSSNWVAFLKDGLLEPSNSLKVVEAGAEGVRFELVRGTDLTIVIEDWAQLRTHQVDVVLDGGTPETRTEPEMPWDGTLTAGGLDANRSYTLWIGGLKGGRYVWARDLRPGREATLKAQQGGVVTGRLLVPEGIDVGKCRVWLFGPYGQGLRAKIDAEQGTYRVEGVPAGTYSLDASCDERRLSARARASAGDVVDLKLEPRR